MLLQISPLSLADRPLIIRSFAGEDHVAEVDGLRAGWILQAESTPVGEWWWSLTGPSCALARVPNTGRCPSFEKAKAELAAAYSLWLEWALRQQNPVSWYSRSRDHQVAPPAAAV
ncbi:hypothetical protein [Aestuariivirga sp.]|uniref:hypothetical protein n=1 Tax=Aestuariivirga sp. TaxID=2650926 RepID=UPI003919C760